MFYQKENVSFVRFNMAFVHKTIIFFYSKDQLLANGQNVINQGRPNGRSQKILNLIMLEFIFRNTPVKINRGCSGRIVDKFNLYN